MKLRKRRRRKRRRRLPTDNPRTPYIPKRGRRNEEKCHHAKEEEEEETNDDASLLFLLAEELEEEEEEEEEEAHLGCLQWSKKEGVGGMQIRGGGGKKLHFLAEETATTDGEGGMERMAKMDVVVPAFFEMWLGRKGF